MLPNPAVVGHAQKPRRPLTSTLASNEQPASSVSLYRGTTIYCLLQLLRGRDGR